MAISDDVIGKCKTTADFHAPLRDVFRAGDYPAVFDSIIRFCELATANRGQARSRLFSFVTSFTSNYVIAAALGGGDMLDWEREFPNLLEALGHPREDRWSDFLIDRATFRREGLGEAIGIIRETIARFLQ